MKPPRRPGKVTTNGRAAREAAAKARILNMENLPKKEKLPANKKEGRGGERARWNIDYEQGIHYAQEAMPGSESGTRRLPKKGGTR